MDNHHRHPDGMELDYEEIDASFNDGGAEEFNNPFASYDAEKERERERRMRENGGIIQESSSFGGTWWCWPNCNG
jgi:hypothetical protein